MSSWKDKRNDFQKERAERKHGSNLCLKKDRKVDPVPFSGQRHDSFWALRDQWGAA